jgi:hypothetical protein
LGDVEHGEVSVAEASQPNDEWRNATADVDDRVARTDAGGGDQRE